MGDPGDVELIDPPSWVGEKIGGDRAEDLIEQATDWSAAGTDVAGAFGVSGPTVVDIGSGVSLGDAGGGVFTAVAQGRASTAQTIPGKVVDGMAAGAADIGMGMAATAAAGPVGAVAIVVDKAVEVTADKVFNTPGISVAATVNGGIRGAVTAVEGAITRDTKGRADFTSKAESGKYGPVVKFFTGLITGRR